MSYLLILAFVAVIAFGTGPRIAVLERPLRRQ